MAANTVLLGVFVVHCTGQTVAAAGLTPHEQVAAIVQQMIDSNQIPGAVVLRANKDKILDTQVLGYADIKEKLPLAAGDEFWIASISKAMAAATLMMLVDEGKVNVDDPVAKYLPEFKGQKVREFRRDPSKPSSDFGPLVPPTHLFTIREMMSHTAGLPFQSTKERDPLDNRPLKDAVKTYAADPLLYQPGIDYTYSNEDLNTAARIVEVVSGMPYETFLQKRLFDPLGMKNTTFWPNAEQIARLPKSYRPDLSGGPMSVIPINQLSSPLDDHKHRFPVPAGGLFSTADDCAAFMQMLANHDVYHGQRILSEASVGEMTSLQTRGLGNTKYGFGLDARPGEFGHSGHQKTYYGVRRKTGAIIVFMTQVDGKIPDFDKKMVLMEDAGDKLNLADGIKP